MSYPKNVRWRCIRCARCCGDVDSRQRRIALLDSEVIELCEYSGLQRESFTDNLAGNEPYTVTMRKIRGKCIFLKGNSCSVYEARPLVCRFYPFWLTREGSKYVFKITEECPGIGHGARLGLEHFISLLRTALNKQV